jgi:hypothetical protein
LKDKSLTTGFMTGLPSPRRSSSGRKSAPEAKPVEHRPARYEDDIYTWVNEQVALLRAGRLDEIDTENIAEELSDVGAEQYHRLESALEVLLMHMLKWDHQSERRSRSWRLTIREQRQRVEKQLQKNPGLKSRLSEAVEDGFALGRTRAAREMDVEPESLPSSCPYEWEAIMN